MWFCFCFLFFKNFLEDWLVPDDDAAAGGGYWIGLSDSGMADEYEWEDGTQGFVHDTGNTALIPFNAYEYVKYQSLSSHKTRRKKVDLA